MTATPRPGTAEDDVFRLREEDRAHPELGRRLRAGKPATLLPEVAGKTGSPRFVKALCDEAERFAGEGARRIAVLVNRVDTARKVRGALNERLGERVLMIGRMRPWDRDRLLARWRKHLAAGPGREPHERPIFVAATQCLEVGADLDFDALVTECASLDALRQRFGRLNRLGSERAPQAAVLAAAGDLQAGRDDFVYGPALRETWQWLAERAGPGEQDGSGLVDFGIDALDALWRQSVKADPGAESELRTRLAPPAPAAPVLLPAHLDLWAQTAPAPMPDPDVGVFLHGAERSAPEVQACWRLDLDPEDAVVLDGASLLRRWTSTVALLPPTSAECMPVPLRVVARWLRGEDRPGEDLVDLEGLAAPAEGSEPVADDSPLRTVLTWRGPEESAIADRGRLPRPGDTVVIPAALGGWEVFGHIPTDADGRLLADVAEPTNFHRRRRAVLRLHPAVLSSWPAGPGRETLDELAGWDEAAAEEEDLEKRVREALAGLPAASRPEELQEVLRELSTQRFDPVPHPAGRGWVLRGRRRVPLEATAPRSQVAEPELYTTDDDSASALAGEVLLADHCRSVAELARRFARSCGVPDPVADDLGLAGRVHDLGKADPRFQAWLHGGNAVAAQLAPLRAKSSGLPQGLRERERARRRAGYPRGARHELLSVRLVESAPALIAAARDPDLVLHLVAAHHGRCRPFAPVIDDEAPVEVVLAEAGHRLAAGSATGLERLDSGVANRFWRLVRRYGWWGLAYLEAILRLADHRQSEAEDVEPQRAGTPPREAHA
jgi:CRISPR-associated endonuclease/helicase Cas3